MAARALSFTDIPLIVILGSTATGKSKLGIGLAKALNGEIISADSMQVYRGLDIITNKVTSEEQREIPHHMINIVTPPSEFTVVQFKNMAINIIKDLHKQKKIPIVVGGTNYYIEALLWDFLVDNREPKESIEEALQQRKDVPGKSYREEGSNESNEHKDLYERLRKVDPQRAEQLHPNNVRKIARSLQIYDTTGKTHTELLKDQKTKYGSSHLSGPLRFSKALVFWLTCNQEVLDQRISDRMEKMVDDGLANEISEFYKQYRREKNYIRSIISKDNDDVKLEAVDNIKNNTESRTGDDGSFRDVADCDTAVCPNIVEGNSDSSSPGCSYYAETTNTLLPAITEQAVSPMLTDTFEDGLFQAIGFKEFHSYVTSTDDDFKRETLFRDGLEKLKRITIKYSKKQKTWVRNRFLARPSINVPDVFDLDVTNLENWKENVLQKALRIAKAFINGDIIPFLPLEKIPHSHGSDKNRMYVCETCNGKIIIGDTTWEAHRASKKHRKLTGRKRKLPLDDSELC